MSSSSISSTESNHGPGPYCLGLRSKILGSWASSEIFQTANVDFRRVHQDRVATDTVTNFTTIVDRLEKQQIQHVYLVTSDFHMPRAEAIATLVLGSRGIRYTAVSVPSQQPSESPLRLLRDVLRSVVWIFTEETGAETRFDQTTDKLNNQIFGQNERH
ncbi:MAG: YdcF family protein [Alkalinema sp. RL_2_19]|nr:YdcF family protein [Alkalinema sp. RL_2_19]